VLFVVVCARARSEREAMPLVTIAPVLRKWRRVPGVGGRDWFIGWKKGILLWSFGWKGGFCEDKSVNQ
jgi:hypothetical protein